MDPTAQAAQQQPAAPTISHIILDDDAIRGDFPRLVQDGRAAGTEQDPARPAKAPETPDQAVLAINQARRAIAVRERRVAEREAAAKAREGGSGTNVPDPNYAKFADLQKSVKSDPYAAAAAIADLTGLDVDDVTTALLQKRAGGDLPKLSAEDRVARLEAEREAERVANAAKDEAAKLAQLEKDTAASTARVKEQITGLVADGEKFPLIHDDLATNVDEVYDLMFMFWKAAEAGQLDPTGKPFKKLTQIQALAMVESQLRADAERKAARLGYQKPQGTAPPPSQGDTRFSAGDTDPRATPIAAARPPAPPTARPAAPAAPRNTGVAPIETRTSIPTDEEIRDDWMRGLRGQ